MGDEVRRIGELANLDLDTADEAFGDQLQSILDYVAVLDELDVADVPPTAFGAAREQRERRDRPRPGLSAEEALCNAPDADAGHFRVPRVIDR